MFRIDKEKTMHVTRGDTAIFGVTASAGSVGYVFQTGQTVRFTVMAKKDCGRVLLKKDITVAAGSTEVTVTLTGEDTRIGDVISKPVDYWYEIELDPDTAPQTLVGYDEDGPKIFRLYPEGGDTQKEAAV